VEKITARRVYPIMAPADYQGRSAGAPVKGPRGLIVSIAECEPGNGPGLHRHLNTVENFLCLSGRFEISWGDQGEQTLVLEPLDLISVPRGENRNFRNVSNELGRLLVMIVPETEQVDPISYAPSVAKEIENEYGKTALEGLQKIGFKFEQSTPMFGRRFSFRRGHPRRLFSGSRARPAMPWTCWPCANASRTSDCASLGRRKGCPNILPSLSRLRSRNGRGQSRRAA
jgi:quercetin dioxygenase-like cupin family protein